MKKIYKEQLDKDTFVKSYDSVSNVEGLNLYEITIINIIFSFERNNQPCYYSYNDWSKILKCSIKTIQRTMKKLKDKGLIDWKSGNSIKNKANEYETTDLLFKVLSNDEPVPEIKKDDIKKKKSKPKKDNKTKKCKEPSASSGALQENKPNNSKPSANGGNKKDMKNIESSEKENTNNSESLSGKDKDDLFDDTDNLFDDLKPNFNKGTIYDSMDFMEYFNNNDELPRLTRDDFKTTEGWNNYINTIRKLQSQGVDL
jgi:DNA-binding HxlR family transcriptional regulator